MSALDLSAPVGVIGAGTMGAGIAQLAAQAGHRVLLFDAADGAAVRGLERTKKGLDRLVERGKMERDAADAITGRIEVAETLNDLAPAGLVVEAIIEDLEIKRGLFAQLEGIVGREAILATNTSSISITAIARDLDRPERFAGMHFFNPAPIMKLVEIVSGVATDNKVAETLFDTGKAWGKVAVHAKSTPGFIVNRVARPFYAEALRLYEEQVADPATIDALLTEGAGFRMGPFTLMDLIGHDVNYAVTRSVFEAYYNDPRYRPSIAQLELVNAGRLGRKSGRGFFDYSADAERPDPATEPVDPAASPIGDLDLGRDNEIDGVIIGPTDGRLARDRATAMGKPVILFDLIAPEAKRIGFTTSPDVPSDFVARIVAGLDRAGLAATRLPDWPGLVTMRTVAMLANEGFEAVMQGVANSDAIDDAMRFGVNYPRGPIEWARTVGLSHILGVVEAIHDLTGDPRYRPSLALRAAAAEG